MRYLIIWLVASLVLGIVVGKILKAKDIGRITSYDIEHKIAYMELHPLLVTGSDSACQGAGMVILTTIESLGKDWKVYVTNTWVPSSKNPIDYEWAKILAEGY